MLPRECACHARSALLAMLPILWNVGASSASGTAMLVISIVLEAPVAIVAVLAARKGKPYLYGLAFTFGAYVLYDLARLLQ